MRVRRAPIVALAACALALGCDAVDDRVDSSSTRSGATTAVPAAIASVGASASLFDAAGIGYADSRLQNRSRQKLPQTSDGVRGAIAPLIPFGLNARRTYETLTTHRMVRGVRFERFAITDYRGRFQGQLLRVDPDTPGLRIDYVGSRYVASDAPLGALLDPQAVAATNGDFFDIRKTGAPLGVGRDRQRGALHGVQEGWNSAFYQDRNDTWHIGPITTTANVVHHPQLHVTTVNSPSVRPGQIGLYTDKWGVRQSPGVVAGLRPHVRAVVVRRGRVAANLSYVPDRPPLRSQLLVGQGTGADQLARLRVGMPLTVRVRYTGQPRVVITGNTRILLNGNRLTIDDVEMHPRTSVGIDRDTGEILMLVVDGRQSFSRGLTMVELANLMRELGAEDAINLDGGGSSTMMGLNPRGRLSVLNSPSDGHPRRIANGLEVLYSPPSGG